MNLQSAQYNIKIPDFPPGNVPIDLAAKIFQKDRVWIRNRMEEGKLPIGVCSKSEQGEQRNFYISPKLLWEFTGYIWKGERDQ